MPYCAHCGGVVPQGDDVRFCPHCGKPVSGSSAGSVSGALNEQIIALLKEGKGLEAIKRHRQETGAGLMEAKAAVEALAARNGLALSSRRPGQGSWVIRFLGCVFAGFMIATAGVAVFPDIGAITKPFVCDDLAVVSQHYSYKPGQSGVTRTFYCGQEGVNFKVMFFTFLIYTAIFFAALTTLKGLRWLFGKKGP